MAYTSDDLVAIERLIAAGTSSIRFSDGREEVYDSMESRMKAKAEISAALAKGSSRPTVRQIRIFSSKGF